jgi:hypothetical protein
MKKNLPIIVDGRTINSKNGEYDFKAKASLSIVEEDDDFKIK